MPVRGIFLVIGSVAIAGIVAALVLRQSAPTNDLSQVSRPDGASAVADDMVSPLGDSPSVSSLADGNSGAARVAQTMPSDAGQTVALPGVAPTTPASAPMRGPDAQPVSVPVTLPLPTGAQMPPSLSGIQLPGQQQKPAPPDEQHATAASQFASQSAMQPASAPPAATGGADATTAPARPAVDETALRYFARQGDTRRLNAEIARLRSLYPDWYPPADMTAPAPVTDALLDNMWRLYSEENYAGVHAAITARMASEPNWKPPADLLTRLNVGESRVRLVNASNAKQYETVVQIAAETPSLLTCADVDILWRVAEAFARTDRSPRARDTNLYILTNCQDPKERLATLQKAMAYLDDAQLDELLALERTSPDGQGEFASVRGDIARRRVGAAAKDPAHTAAPEDLALLGELAKAGSKPDDAILLGSYLFTHGDAEGSVTWWQLARTRADTPQIARGLAYALNALDRPAEAEAAAYRWRGAGPDNKQVYLVVSAALLAIDPPAKIEAEVMTRMAKAIGEAKFAQGAQELGWYAYNTGQTLAAARWFSAALTWQADMEPAAYGLALAAQKLGDKAALAQILHVWGPRSQRIADLGDPRRQAADALRGRTFELPPSIVAPGASGQIAPAPIAAPAAVQVQAPVRDQRATQEVIVPQSQTVDAGSASANPVPSSRPLQRRAATGARGTDCRGFVPADTLRGAAALNRGWCLMGYNRPIEAADAFDAAMRSTTGTARQDAAYGKSLANLRAGLTDSAAVAASAAPQSNKRATELQTAIITQRALAAYTANRWTEAVQLLDMRSQIAPEQQDLMMVRGWSYYHLGRMREAKRLFSALAQTGSREAARALATMATFNQGTYFTDDRDRR